MKKEEWKPVVGYEGIYSVSNLGRVRSEDRIIEEHNGRQRINKGRVLKPFGTGKCRAYLAVDLRKNGKRKTTKVHRLVAIAFISNPDDCPQVNHLNGDKSNNTVSNLEWTTNLENARHAYRTGLKVTLKGSAVWNSKLTKEDVLLIREMEFWNLKRKEIARLFDVSTVLIGKIMRREVWTHV